MDGQTSLVQAIARADDDSIRRRLMNVFRVLARPLDQRRSQAIELREVISAEWHQRAQDARWINWSVKSDLAIHPGLPRTGWWEQGMLGFLGYHVGQTNPTSRDARRCILAYVFECNLPPLNGPGYFFQWGAPHSARRLVKLADTAASLARNAIRRDSRALCMAIRNWEEDLEYLHERYYVGRFDFPWPTTNSLREDLRSVG